MIVVCVTNDWWYGQTSQQQQTKERERHGGRRVENIKRNQNFEERERERERLNKKKLIFKWQIQT